MVLIALTAGQPNSVLEVRSDFRSAAGPPNLRYLERLLAESSEESDGGQHKRSDEIRRDPQAEESRMAVEDLGPDIVEGIGRVKAKDGPDLIVWGSSTLTSVLLEHGLADEILLFVFPVLLGTGKRISSYRPSGHLRTGNFGDTAA